MNAIELLEYVKNYKKQYGSLHIITYKWPNGRKYYLSERYYPGVEVDWTDIQELDEESLNLLLEYGVDVW